MTEPKDNGGPAYPQSDTLIEDGAMLVKTAHGGMTLGSALLRLLGGQTSRLMSALARQEKMHSSVIGRELHEPQP